VLYAGTVDNGLYRSADSGATWEPVTTLPAPLSVAVSIVGTVGPPIIYVRTNAGIFQSQDDAKTWQPSAVYAGLDGCPATPQMQYGQNAAGLLRSTDGGLTWTALKKLSSAYSYACDPTNPSLLYALGPGGVYRSTDAGDSWVRMSDIPPDVVYPAGMAEPPIQCSYFSTHCLAASTTFLYMASGQGVFRSADGGGTWSATTITAPADDVLVDPNDPQVVYANADRVYRSENGGANWSVILTPVQHTVGLLAVPPTMPSVLAVGSLLPQTVFVTKLGPDGKILYSTYLGGSYFDYPTGVAVDRDGYAYITGLTYSSDFPVTAGAIQSTLAGTYNAFLAKLSPDGTTLAYSTFLGGSGTDSAQAIALDNGGNVYLTGWAGSVDFPVTPSALQTQIRQGCGPAPYHPANGDAWVAKISRDGSNLLYSTFLGGTCADEGLGIVVDSSGSAYVTGVTTSPDFPTTAGSYKPVTQALGNTGFLAKLTPSGDGLVYATYIGGPGTDTAEAVAVDSAGNAYVTGATVGLEDWYTGPTGACEAQYTTYGADLALVSGGAGYILKLSPSGTAKVFSRYLGLCYTTGTSIALDPAGRIWVGGPSGFVVANWIDLFAHGAFGLVPTVATLHPFQGGGLGAGFVSEIAADGSTLLFSSLVDSVWGMALDPNGNAYIGGYTTATSIPKTPPSVSVPYRSALAIRIDGAVQSTLTIEEPRSLANYLELGQDVPFITAPGARLAIPGTGLGPARKVIARLADGMLPTMLGDTSVYFDGVPAPLLSVQAEEVACIGPFEMSGHTSVTVQVERNGSLSNAVRVPVSQSAVDLLWVTNEDGTYNSSDHPAPGGSLMTAYVAGMGQTNPSSVDGRVNGTDGGSLINPATVLFVATTVDGGVYTADILSAGPAPGQVAGVGQIRFQIPDRVIDGKWQLSVGTGDDLDVTTVYIGSH